MQDLVDRELKCHKRILASINPRLKQKVLAKNILATI